MWHMGPQNWDCCSYLPIDLDRLIYVFIFPSGSSQFYHLSPWGFFQKRMEAHVIKSIYLRCPPTWHVSWFIICWTGYNNRLECASYVKPNLFHLCPCSGFALGLVPMKVGSGPAAVGLQSLLKVSVMCQELKMLSFFFCYLIPLHWCTPTTPPLRSFLKHISWVPGDWTNLNKHNLSFSLT